MPRPEIRHITFTIDGREVTAPENAMLVDAAKYGDVEIPVFCYEPKLGPPVGACRMCLVEVEGIPKLQTACSTPVKDGMVVNTQTERVQEAQKAVVEFLLINHPLDCPVCDKGGECPLQDITYGWGPGKSRFIEPKRHFKKPLALSPLIAIDRERCILCYRCVRFSQEVSEDHQLVLRERGTHTFVATFDGHPYVGPFSGNIIELCPVGALTSTPYRFRARPWDSEDAGSICTLCPSQCNVRLTVRDERVMRVGSRANEEVDDGWLCDKGRFAFEHIHVDERVHAPMVRDGGELRPVSWERALDEAARGLARAGRRAAALAGGETTNEEALLLARLFRDGLESPHLSAGPGGELPLELAQALGAPPLQATMTDIEFAHTVLVLGTDPVEDMAILDLRLRKGVRRRGVRVGVATDRPSALDGRAAAAVRFAPGAGEALLVALDAVLAGTDDGGEDERAAAAGVGARDVRALADLLTGVGEDVVIVWGERLLAGPRGANAARALLSVARRLGLAEREGAGLLEVPSSTNGRGLREVGFSPVLGPGFSRAPEAGRDADGIADGLVSGDLTALYLLHADPLRTQPRRARWVEALERASTVITHTAVLTDAVRAHATVVFPAEAYAEKEGTIVHPDGRLQRLRIAIGKPRGVKPAWQVIAEVGRRAGFDLRVLAGPMASRLVFDAVPFYAGLTLDEVGSRGVRWWQRDAASAYPEPVAAIGPPEAAAPAPAANGRLRLGTFHSLWAAPEVEVSPHLKFLRVEPRAELAPGDARRLGIAHGDRVEVGTDGVRVQATASLRVDVPEGTVFLQEGTREQPANLLTGDGPGLVEVRRA